MMPSSGSTHLWPNRWSTGFDGTQYYNWKMSQNEFIMGEVDRSARKWAPRSLVWEDSDDLVRTLEETDRSNLSIAITERAVGGLKCYVVEGKNLVNRQWGSEIVVSPLQGFLPIARKWTLRGKTYSSRSLEGVHEVTIGSRIPSPSTRASPARRESPPLRSPSGGGSVPS